MSNNIYELTRQRYIAELESYNAQEFSSLFNLIGSDDDPSAGLFQSQQDMNSENVATPRTNCLDYSQSKINQFDFNLSESSRQQIDPNILDQFDQDPESQINQNKESIQGNQYFQQAHFNTINREKEEEKEREESIFLVTEDPNKKIVQESIQHKRALNQTNFISQPLQKKASSTEKRNVNEIQKSNKSQKQSQKTKKISKTKRIKKETKNRKPLKLNQRAHSKPPRNKKRTKEQKNPKGKYQVPLRNFLQFVKTHLFKHLKEYNNKFYGQNDKKKKQQNRKIILKYQKRKKSLSKPKLVKLFKQAALEEILKEFFKNKVLQTALSDSKVEPKTMECYKQNLYKIKKAFDEKKMERLTTYVEWQRKRKA